MLAMTGTTRERPAARPGETSHLQLRQGDNPAAALGTAVSYLMTRPAFARLTFGHWSRVLVGQISRGHYAFVYEGHQVVGFAGWALASAAEADALAEGDAGAPTGDGRTGECLVVTAWAANSPDAQRLLIEHLRRAAAGKRVVYAKRLYRDRRSRPARPHANPAVQQPVITTAARPEGGAMAPEDCLAEPHETRTSS